MSEVDAFLAKGNGTLVMDFLLSLEPVQQILLIKQAPSIKKFFDGGAIHWLKKVSPQKCN